MAWIAICRDNPDRDTAALRRDFRDRHFAYIESILPRLLAAGPLAEPGSTGHGASLFIYDVATEAEARVLLAADPYFTAGIYGELRVEPWWPAAGRWLGGTIWQQRDG
jgi:uncharacterized protein YciI